jgi:multicomponent Na+:H+ antiporter subunit G
MDLSLWLSTLLLLVGAVFFLAGTIGLLRFPDVFARLHAITKADNLGLGFTVFGLALQAESWRAVGMLLLIWALVLLAGTTCCHLVANAALRAGIRPWSRG